MTRRRPLAVAFDVNETLVDLAGLRPELVGMGLAPEALEWWFAAVLRDGMALAAAGDAAPFAALARGALEEVSTSGGRALPEGAADALLARFARLTLHGDVAPAFERLAAAGVPALALTNGNAAVAGDLIEQAGLRHLVGPVLSVDDAGHWKPRPEPYRYAAAEVGLAVEELAMVAVHPWDLHGAARAGLVTAWVNRTGRSYPPVFAPPDVEAAGVDEVVARLLSLPA